MSHTPSNSTSKPLSPSVCLKQDDYYELTDCQVHAQSSEHAEHMPFTIDGHSGVSHGAEHSYRPVRTEVQRCRASQAPSQRDLEKVRQKTCKYGILVHLWVDFELGFL